MMPTWSLAADAMLTNATTMAMFVQLTSVMPPVSENTQLVSASGRDGDVCHSDDHVPLHTAMAITSKNAHNIVRG